MRVLAFACAAAALVSFSARATDVLDVANLAAIKALTTSNPATNVNAKGFATANDGGGGQFAVATCNGATNDDGVVLVDASSRCWFRQFTGPVDVAWYGAINAIDPANTACHERTTIASCDASAIMTKAFNAAETYGDGGVTTGGRSIVISGADLVIGNHQYLTCGGAVGGGVAVDAYQDLANSIILDPSRKINERGSTRFEHCIVRPTWLIDSSVLSPTPAIPPTTIRDVIDIMHTFTGTAIDCDSPACVIDDILVMGFDVCLETSGSSHTLIDNARAECNVGVWNHTAGGGNKISNVTVDNLVESNTKFNSIRIDQRAWPLTNTRNDGSGGVIVTLTQKNFTNAIAVGDTVLVADLGPPGPPVSTTGTPNVANAKINNIPASTGALDGAGDIHVGDTVTDAGSAGCTQTVVLDIDVDPDDGTGSAKVDGTGWSCTTTPAGEPFVFSHSASSPPSGNGHWRVKSVAAAGSCPDAAGCVDIGLQGAAWTSVAPLVPTWNAKTQVISMLDTTNIAPGQYLCTSGTVGSVPFCTPPSGFAFSTTTTTTLGALGTGLGQITVGSVANWPRTGLVKAGAEYLGYTILNATTVNIVARGVDGTTVSTHSGTVTLQAAAPTALFVNAKGGAIMVSAPAQTTCALTCIGTTLVNDPYVTPGVYIGQIVLNPGYHMYTATAAAGGNPSAETITVGSGTSGTHVLNVATGMGFKAQPGMTVADLNGSPAWSGTLTVDSVSGDAVTLQGAAFSGTFSGHNVQFTGCGYPGFAGTTSGSFAPWLGNCAATSLLVGGDGQQSQGFVCEYFHSFGNEIQIHTIDASAMSCTNPVIAGGGGAGDQLDPDAVAIWLDGKATKSQFTNGRVAGARISILDTPQRFKGGHFTGQSDGIGFANMTVPGSIILGADAKLTLTGVHGNASESVTPIFLPSTMEDIVASGLDMHDWTAVVDSTANYPRMYCSGNSLATALCGQERGTPTCSSGCTNPTDVSGSDTDFDVAPNGVATTVSIVLAGSYPTAPICKISAGAAGGGAATAVAISSVDPQSYGTTVTFKTTSAVTHIYGGCKPPA